MFADWVQATHNGTGGTGTLTLAAVSGSPQPSDVWGTTATKIVYYSIDEYTDNTFATLKQGESGMGSLNLSTGVLTRSVVWRTWVSGAGYVVNGASAINVGATAANVRILLSATANLMRPAQPAINALAGLSGWLPFNTRQTWDSGNGNTALSAGNRHYCPIEFVYGKPITAVALNVGTIASASSTRLGIYDWDTDGLPGNLITEFTATAQINTGGSTGYNSVSVTPPFIPPGWYWLCIQSSGAPSIANLTLQGNPGAGDSGSRDLMYYYKGATYGPLPATADKTYSAVISRSAGGQLAAFCK